MATYDVKIDEKGRMTFEPGLAQSAASLEAYPAAKKMARVLETQFQRFCLKRMDSRWLQFNTLCL